MINIESRDNAITHQESRYWKRLFRSNLKIGVECEFEVIDENSYALMSALRRELEPTDAYNKFGKSGISGITTDGSLRNGIEVQFLGRRLDFLDLYIQYYYFYTLIKNKATITERCGLHNHVLMSYNGISESLEKPVPGIIFKNFAQLLRKHSPELVWITSTCHTDYDDSITRFDYFCQIGELMSTTPVGRDAQRYIGILRNSSRYRFLNTQPMVVTGDQIERFHFELRFPDGSIYPAQIAAQNILYAAFLMKAIEVSELGLMSTGRREEWEDTKLLYSSIRNRNNGDERLSEPPIQEEIDSIMQRGRDMLKFLKPQLDSFDSHVYRILTFLNETPISIERRTKTDNQIVGEYHSLVNSMFRLDLSEYKNLIQTIITQEHTGCINQDIWCREVALKHNVSETYTRKQITYLENIKPLFWDNEIGSYVFR